MARLLTPAKDTNKGGKNGVEETHNQDFFN